MFIASNKRFKIRRNDGDPIIIPNGFVGEIPDDVAKEWIIKAAIKDGAIVTTESKKDTAIEKAVSEGKAKITKTQKKKEEA